MIFIRVYKTGQLLMTLQHGIGREVLVQDSFYEDKHFVSSIYTDKHGHANL